MTAVLDDRTDAAFRRAPLAALGFGSFAYVTAETLPVGLLPQIADGLSVPEAQVGLLMTTYAAVAGLTAIPFTAFTIGVSRNRLIALCVAVFTVSQVLAAVAPTFEVLAASRLVAALAHGVFWAALGPVAARLAPPGQVGRATSFVFVGNSIALVAGVPLGTALGQLAGWRASFALMAVAGAVATVALLRLLPALPPLDTQRTVPPLARIRAAVGVVRDRGVGVVCIVTAVVVIGHFAAYTYIAPLVHRAGGLDGLALSALLLGYGGAGLIGNLVGGRAVDRRPGPGLAGFVGIAVAALVAIALTPGTVGTVLAVLAWGVGFSAVPVSLQSAILRVAPHAQDSASALYVVAFQIGIGGGALLGERLYAGGQLGLLPGLAALTALIALAVVVGARGSFPRRTARAQVALAQG
ncbi:Predicted arabinose efflux permease, MFS family [Jatrophihabitans endophyticus]|uniref:Predicted arabinose efflux permease, MFS family n=1 Tax=Jatrophihabitans endophyticus TaxID=1206085 RepID=A0A1M5T6R2_9ACTN|nr:MFS transporter [Jatrophihabitans endophyticus]SHH46396.1 Predicted arabinose efflux permease, MFS family [Jatrophihabitans endophyticus]